MRLWHWLRARLGGYFWEPCPICGKNFGGHEWGDTSLATTPHSGVGVCPKCIPEAKRRNEENWKRWRTEPKWWVTYK